MTCPGNELAHLKAQLARVTRERDQARAELRAVESALHVSEAENAALRGCAEGMDRRIQEADQRARTAHAFREGVETGAERMLHELATLRERAWVQRRGLYDVAAAQGPTTLAEAQQRVRALLARQDAL